MAVDRQQQLPAPCRRRTTLRFPSRIEELGGSIVHRGVVVVHRRRP